MPTLDAQLSNAEKRLEIAAAKLRATQLEQSYRAIEDGHNRRKRNTPAIEFKGEDEQIGKHGRLKSVAKSRDTRRNYGGAKAAELQLKLNVVGTGPKVIVHFTDDAKTKEWSNWFNSTFAKRCDGRGSRHLADQASIVFASVIREGDVLAYFARTDAIQKSQGTLWYWEADQLPELEKQQFDSNKNKIRDALQVEGEIHQQNGLITDEYGRVQGYIVCGDYATFGKASAKYEDVTILPAEDCTLLYNPWRINQKRGISDTMETANQWQDLERFTEALLQRSIVQSYIAFKVKKKQGTVQGRDRLTDSDNPNGIPDVTSAALDSGKNYKNFEKLSQNAIEYLDDTDEDIEAMQMAGDLPDAQALIEFMQNGAGWSQGLSAMYATGKADASYSASMAESNMTWALFIWWQKWIERYFFDWVAEKAFAWALSDRRITPARAFEWMDNYSWHGWPKRKAINPAQEATARKTDLEIGAIDYEDIHGPYWPDKLRNLGAQIKYSRDNGLWVPMWATGRPVNG